MSSALGPMISEWNEEVVFRMCDTAELVQTSDSARTIVQEESLTDWPTHRTRLAVQVDEQGPEYIRLV